MALIIAGVMLVLLFLAFGSLVLPVKAVLVNLLSISASFGVITWIFANGHLEGPLGFTSTGFLDATQPIFMLAILVGLSMDYEVFLLSRIREQWDLTHDNTLAVATGVQRTGRIITSAALLLAVVIGAFSTSGIVFMKMIGIGMLVALLVDATIVRMLLVPATMKLLGDWNWWAPAGMRRWWERHGIREGVPAPAEPAPERESRSPSDEPSWLSEPCVRLTREWTWPRRRRGEARAVSLLVHRAPRADQLVPGLAALLRRPAGRPVRAGARARARSWRRTLAEPAALPPSRAGGGSRGRCLRRSAVPVARQPGRRDRRATRDHDPWAPDALVWPLLSVVDAHAGEPWCRVLSQHLGHGESGEEGDLRRGRRYAVARRLAQLFASYAVQRPTLLADWEAGRDTDGAGGDARSRPGLAARAVAAAGRRGRRAFARASVTSPCSPSCVSVPSRSTCRSGSRCSGTPGSRSPRSSCWPRWASTATCTCGCRTPRRRSGTR